MDFWIGVSLGVLLTIPLAAVLSKREAKRVRRLEQRTRAAERLAELGTLTGGLAHEIKNPLSTVGLNVQLLQEELDNALSEAPVGALSEERLGRIQRRFASLSRETGRLRDILEDFLRFAGRVKLQRAQTDIHVLVNELADFFTPQAQAAGVQLRTQLDAHSGLAHVDPSLLKQALLNLMINAIQAMQDARNANPPKPHGGANELILRTHCRRGPNPAEMQIHVIDTGPGIQAENLKKVFQPYFSTNRSGTGLGLPTTRRIVEEHDGTITVHTATGRGTDFLITLPMRNPNETRSSGDEPEPQKRR